MAKNAPRIPLPEDWPRHVRTGIIHVISLAQVALTAARAGARKRGVVGRLRAKVEEQAGEISLLTEELSLKDLRMGRVRPRRRPHYRGVERLRILTLKAARGWSKSQAERRREKANRQEQSEQHDGEADKHSSSDENDIREVIGQRVSPSLR